MGFLEFFIPITESFWLLTFPLLVSLAVFFLSYKFLKVQSTKFSLSLVLPTIFFALYVFLKFQKVGVGQDVTTVTMFTATILFFITYALYFAVNSKITPLIFSTIYFLLLTILLPFWEPVEGRLDVLIIFFFTLLIYIYILGVSIYIIYKIKKDRTIVRK